MTHPDVVVPIICLLNTASGVSEQHKFMQSMTWYRPHGTFTHRVCRFKFLTRSPELIVSVCLYRHLGISCIVSLSALLLKAISHKIIFRLALWICIMNDLNSFFQILLSACMWSMDRFERPAWTTATTLPAAFVAGILAGVFIWQGGKKTRRHEQVEARLRAALAMERSSRSSTKSATSLVRGNEFDTKEGPSVTVTSSSTPAVTDASPPRSKDFATDEEGNVGMKGKAMLRGKGEDAAWANEGEFDPSVLKAQQDPYEEVVYPPTRRVSSSYPPIAEQMTVPRVEDLYAGTASMR